MMDIDGYQGKSVFVTGHTGFKGSWLSLWLKRLGANVIGYSLKPNTTPNHFELLDLNIKSYFSDINDNNSLKNSLSESQPEIVFHLAAQPIVSYSYDHPFLTFQDNIMGTASLLEACRQCDSIKAIVVITSDKCYKNESTNQNGFVESDPLGGSDPYSASKACAEIVVESYQKSFFSLDTYDDHGVLLATARAGNVIGGGDWSKDRLIPDLVRSYEKNEAVQIRSPQSIRPWQHVLECTYGYLLLGEQLLRGNKDCSGAFNFGPDNDDVYDVQTILDLAKTYWPNINYFIQEEKLFLESTYLCLNNNKAKEKLGWVPFMTLEKRVEETMLWYHCFYEKGKVDSINSLESIEKKYVRQ